MLGPAAPKGATRSKVYGRYSCKVESPSLYLGSYLKHGNSTHRRSESLMSFVDLEACIEFGTRLCCVFVLDYIHYV